MRHNTCIGHRGGWFSHVATSNIAGLPRKDHLHIKDNLALDECVTWWKICIIVQDVVCKLGVLHFLLNWIHQAVLLLSLSIWRASFTVDTTAFQNLWIFLAKRVSILPMIWSRLFRANGTYKKKSGSETSFALMAYTATSTGFDSFKSLRASQLVDPSFHFTQTEVQSLGCELVTSVAIWNNVPILYQNGCVIFGMVNKYLQE